MRCAAHWFSVFLGVVPSFAVSASADDAVLYNRDVRPVLAENCFACHGPDKAARQADLRLDLRESAIKAEALVPNKPDASEAIRRIFSADKAEQMPPPASHKKLTKQQKDLLRRWVAAGAEYQPHWSFIRPIRGPLPLVKNTRWEKNPIDRFILAKLEAMGLKPAPEADRPTLARRVSLDLTGLPPSPSEVDAMMGDGSPDAYEKLVDRLLVSPHWGEHRARYWLDAARYADSNGLHFDNFREIWSYRDWVIEAFNRNLPFDRFTIEQLAGDLLPTPTLPQRIASGFNRCNMTTNEGGTIPEENLVFYTRDRTETTSQVWLGLTAGCAVCHDHKFDPIGQKEFYQMAAFFNNTTQDALDGNIQDTPPVIVVPPPRDRLRWDALAKELADVRKQIESHEQSARPEFDQWIVKTKPDKIAAQLGVKDIKPTPTGTWSDADKKKIFAAWLGTIDPSHRLLSTRRSDLEKEEAGIRARSTVAHVMQERGEAAKAYLLFRGQYDQRRDEVRPATFACLPPMPPQLPRNRLGVAEWLVRPEQPLMARVAVNRFWQEVFGVGIVRTAGDFGATGEPPTHPELLDWLAVEFRESGWNVKRLFRLLVTSATYRQSAQVTSEKLEKDPLDRFYSRGPRFRMDGEMIRDYALAAGGLLVPKIGGPSVKPYQPPGVWEAVAMRESNTRDYHQDQGENLYRRSLYTFWKRAAPPASMDIFNAPSREVCTVRRERTNTPLQSLVTLNDPQFIEAARHLAQVAIKEGGPSDASRLTLLAKRLLARPLRNDELPVVLASLENLLAYYKTHADDAAQLLAVGESKPDPSIPRPQLAGWTMLANELLNLDETLNK